MSEETSNQLKLFISSALQQQDLRWQSEIIQLGMDLRVEMQQGYQKLDAKINSLDTKIDSVHDKLDAKIDLIHDKLDSKIDHLASTVFDALDSYYGDHEKRIQKLELNPAS